MPTKRPTMIALCRATFAGGAGVLLAATGCAGPNNDSDVFSDLMQPFIKPTPSQVAREAFNVYDADKRRRSVALISASSFGHEQPYVRMYRLLIDDQDPTVRASCAHALGLHGTAEDALIIIPLLHDSTGFVRWEAAKALQKLHNDQAIRPLIETLTEDEDADVRMAAATALGQYPNLAVYNALVGALSYRDFGVVQASADSLALLTGEDLGTDGVAWLDFAADNPGARLFANQQLYTYTPYQKPPGRLQKMKFWEEKDPIRPQIPTGLERTQADDVGNEPSPS